MVDQKKLTGAVSRVIPVIVLGIIGYASYVVTGPLCVDYLLSDSYGNRRSDAAIAILVLLYVLFVMAVSSYIRILSTLATDPGLVERSGMWKLSSKQKANKKHNLNDKEKSAGDNDVQSYSYSEAAGNDMVDPEGTPGSLLPFYEKEVFVCQPDGRPPWCSRCMAWKPDRAHHCSELDRCVKKMDHFCPWVGGIVSETNYKFFVQFVLYAFGFCLLITVVLAYFISEQRNRFGVFNAHLAVGLGLAAFFLLFTFGMTLATWQQLLLNLTSIEHLSRNTAVWTLAVHIPENHPSQDKLPYSTMTFPLSPPQEGQPQQTPRTFAIIHSKPGDNPFDLGYFGNFQSVMGYTIWDWLLPIRRSPCCNHDDPTSHWELGPVVRRMREDYGLAHRKRRSSRP